jgi:RimJ/RimL family protein N-acetyltransferase
LTLSPASPRERAAAQRWARDPEVARFLSSPDGMPPAVDRSGAWWEGLFRRREEAIFAIRLTENDEHIGNLGLHNWERRRGEAELGIIIGHPSNFDRGYGTEAIQTLLREAFSRWGLREVRLQVLADNVRGRRCYEKCGFKTDRLVRSKSRFGSPAVDVVYMSATAPQEDAS